MRTRRRWLAAVLAAAAVAFAIDAVAPAPPPSSPVVVASDVLAPGTRLTVDDLHLMAWPDDQVPPGAVRTVEDAVGRTLAGAVGQGEAITGLRLVGPTLSAALAHDGRVAVPVRLADADAAALLRPGDRVDLVSATAGSADPVAGASGGPEASVVAEAATVISVPANDDGSALIGGRGDAGGSLVVVTVTRAEALALARAAVLGPLSIILVP